MKRQSINNANFREAHGLVRFVADIHNNERTACRASAHSGPAIVRAGMQALGIKALISKDNPNKSE